MSRLCLMVLCAALAACQSPTVPLASSASDAAGKGFAPPPPGKATLYVAAGYIPDVATISVGQTIVGSLAQRTWLRADLQPGSYDIHARSPYTTSSLSVTLAPGSITYTQLWYVDLRPWTDRLSETTESNGRELVLGGKRVAQGQSIATDPN
jgi:hypothetical protein